MRNPELDVRAINVSWLTLLVCAAILLGTIVGDVLAQTPTVRVNFTSALFLDINIPTGTDAIVQCFDSSGFWFQPQSVQIANPTNAHIIFSTPTTGRCVAK
jgi:hypothetical protein